MQEDFSSEARVSEVNEKELNAAEAARMAGIRLDVLYPLLRVGRIRARKQDGQWRISEEGLAAYLKKRETRHHG
jgi:predicted site-specific integrase-resolvase